MIYSSVFIKVFQVLQIFFSYFYISLVIKGDPSTSERSSSTQKIETTEDDIGKCFMNILAITIEIRYFLNQQI